MSTAVLLALSVLATQAPANQAPSFDYHASPIHIVTGQDDVVVRQISYEKLDGGTNGATLVTARQASPAPRPGVLFVHWYEPRAGPRIAPSSCRKRSNSR